MIAILSLTETRSKRSGAAVSVFNSSALDCHHDTDDELSCCGKTLWIDLQTGNLSDPLSIKLFLDASRRTTEKMYLHFGEIASKNHEGQVLTCRSCALHESNVIKLSFVITGRALVARLLCYRGRKNSHMLKNTYITSASSTYWHLSDL